MIALHWPRGSAANFFDYIPVFESTGHSKGGSLGIAVILNKRRRGFCMNREKGSKKIRAFP
jgi:hypothetical protein